MPGNGVGYGIVVGVPVGSGVKVVVGGGVFVAGEKELEHAPRDRETVTERKTRIAVFI